MSGADSDVSWEMLRRIVRQWSGDSAELSEISSLDGGSINTVLQLKLEDGASAVLKICPHRVNLGFADEAAQLKLLGEMGVPVPQVYDVHVGSLDQPVSYLLMEHVKGVHLGKARQACTKEEYDRLQTQLAEMVSALHDCTAECYCQVGTHRCKCGEDWANFYRASYDDVLNQVLQSKLLRPKCAHRLQKIHDRLEEHIQHSDCPRLVHGDLWGTNVLAKRDESGGWRVAGVIDPMCRFAHAETEIAYLELFHTVNGAFTRSYRQRHPLSAGYFEHRRAVYQMYFLLDHVNLFGQSYVPQFEQALNSVA